ncbi:MAG: hypothetical protein ABH829_00895 [archaeon]
MVRAQFYLVSTIFAAMFLLAVFFSQLYLHEYSGEADDVGMVLSNIEQECLRAVEISYSQSSSQSDFYQRLESNLGELEAYFGQRMAERNCQFAMNYSISPSSVSFSLELDNGKTKISDGFSVTQPQIYIYP